MPFLIDTNVLSELRKGPRCDPNVKRWARAAINDRHCISVLSLGEIRKGIELLRNKSPEQCPAFERWLTTLQTDYQEDILLVTENTVDRWGNLMATRPMPVIDSLIAATALEHNLTIVTRNTADFERSGADVLDPFVD